MRRVRRNFPGVAGWGKVSLVFQTAAANVVEYELRRRVIAFQNLRHGHLPLAALLQPEALFIQPMPCSRGFSPMSLISSLL